MKKFDNIRGNQNSHRKIESFNSKSKNSFDYTLHGSYGYEDALLTTSEEEEFLRENCRENRR